MAIYESSVCLVSLGLAQIGAASVSFIKLSRNPAATPTRAAVV